MSQFIEVPIERLEPDVLQALLEEFASRDGTDYGDQERSMEQKVDSLSAQLAARSLCLLFDTEGEHWDLLPSEQAQALLND